MRVAPSVWSLLQVVVAPSSFSAAQRGDDSLETNPCVMRDVAE